MILCFFAALFLSKKEKLIYIYIDTCSNYGNVQIEYSYLLSRIFSLLKIFLEFALFFFGDDIF